MRRFSREVVAVEDRVERLVQPGAVAGERAAQDALLNRADLALYEAKKGGRNCVRMAKPPLALQGRAVNPAERRKTQP